MIMCTVAMISLHHLVSPFHTGFVTRQQLYVDLVYIHQSSS